MHQSSVELSEGFFETIVRRPVPIVEGAVRLLANTAMPLDLYLWLAYRLHVLERPTPVSWDALHHQFGAGTAQVKHFKPRFVRDIRLALAVYPEAQGRFDGYRRDAEWHHPHRYNRRRGSEVAKVRKG